VCEHARHRQRQQRRHAAVDAQAFQHTAQQGEIDAVLALHFGVGVMRPDGIVGCHEGPGLGRQSEGPGVKTGFAMDRNTPRLRN